MRNPLSHKIVSHGQRFIKLVRALGRLRIKRVKNHRLIDATQFQKLPNVNSETNFFSNMFARDIKQKALINTRFKFSLA